MFTAHFRAVNHAIDLKSMGPDPSDEVGRVMRSAPRAMENSAWRNMSQSDRGALLYKLSELVQRDTDGLSRLETRDNGKPLKEMTALTQAVATGMR